jgi:predicted regulator of Ras-like GTPase activity (Roadblock/LC7/MglB family)
MIRTSTAIGWADVPLKRFVDDARLNHAVLMHSSGQVLAQIGFKRSLDVQTACALSAAINASAEHLGSMLDGTPFRAVHYAGKSRQLFLGQIKAPGATLLVLAVFDSESSLGIVQLYAKELQVNIAAVAPAATDNAPALAENFEHDLNRNLSQLFGRG